MLGGMKKMAFYDQSPFISETINMAIVTMEDE